MKIGVLTHHWVANFGANLQAYATSSFLSRMGHNVVFINFRPAFSEDSFNEIIQATQLNAHKCFVGKHLRETSVVRNLDEFYEIVNEFKPDCLITGSDAVFRLQPNANRVDQVFPNPYWLPRHKKQDGKKLIRVALSASAMGCRFDRLSQSVRNGINQSISDMDHVSVRDEWTALQLKRVGVDRKISLTPDPVFMLREEIDRRKQEFKKTDPYILVGSGGIMRANWMRSFTRLANKKGIEVISLPLPEGKWDVHVNRKIAFPLDPFRWMDLIANSSGYVGLRFHPIVISLISNVPFVSLDYYHKGFWDASRSKTINLLRLFHLQDYAYGQVGIRFLSPHKVLRMLDTQKNLTQKISAVSRKLDETLQNYLREIFQI